MGNGTNCCSRDEINIDNIIEERNEIFNFSPDDDKVPNDQSFISNQGGEYPTETERPADFRYEAKYPNLVDNEKIIIKNLPQDKIYENEEYDYNQEMKYLEKQQNAEANILQKEENRKLRHLFDLCNRNGKPRPCDDFNPKYYKYFYPESEPYFNIDKNECFPGGLKIINENDENFIQIYEGEVNAAGQRHGIGKCTTPNGVFIGMWKNDKFSGWGRESKSNGEVFEGRYENGLLNGKGIYLNEKKCKYVGDFKYSRKWGEGELTTDKIVYKGNFYNNQFHGRGRIKFLGEGIEYMGTFNNDKIDGQGVFTYKNGDKYIGQVKNGKIHGIGKIIKNGVEYRGYFTDGETISEKMKKYEMWKNNGYEFKTNFQNQNSNMKTIQGYNMQNQLQNSEKRLNSRPVSNKPNNMKQKNIPSDYRNN